MHYDSPLSVAQAKQALLEENASWIGALQEEGSSRRVGGNQQLKPGSRYILTLQCQAGECYLPVLLYCCCLVLGFAIECKAIIRYQKVFSVHYSLTLLARNNKQQVHSSSLACLFCMHIQHLGL